MASGNGSSRYLTALEMAEAHFPDQKRLVQRLFYVNEAFHGICEDLAAAAEALAHVDRLPENVQEVRRKEYASLVDALLKEMREAIAQSKIVIFRPPSNTGRRYL